MIDWIKKATQQATSDHNFHVKSQPNVLDTSTTLTLTTFTNKSEISTVPCNYRWFRIRNGLTEEISKFRGSTYICQPSDIGSVIEVEITSMDSQFFGQKRIKYGPVKMDLNLKKQIETTLSSGSTIMNAYLCYKNEEKQCQFKIFEDMIKICHCYSQANYTFNYSIYQPRIEAMQKDNTKVQIIFSERYTPETKRFLRAIFTSADLTESMRVQKQCRIEIKFMSRVQKDMFIFILKSFYTKRQLKNAIVLQKIQHTNFSQNQAFNYLLEIETLKTDLQRAIDSNSRIQSQKIKYQEETKRLSKEIEEMATNYTKIIEEKVKDGYELNQSYSVLTAKRDDVFGRKCQNLQHQNLNLNERIKLLTNEIDEIRRNTETLKNNQTVQNANQPSTFPQQNAFTKKKISGYGHEETNFLKILDQLQESQVVRQNEDYQAVKFHLETMKEENKDLEKKLQKSFQKIDVLEKQLHQQSSIIHNVNSGGFRYGGYPFNEKQDPMEMEKLKRENSELHLRNEYLSNENKNLQQLSSSSMSRIIIKNDVSSNSGHQRNIEKENQNLKHQIRQLEMTIADLIAKNERMGKDLKDRQRKIGQLQKEIELHRQNQNALNRSQYLSMEMDSYNEEQLRILKQHNEFLTNENQKLVKACQKYMAQAKQSAKIRQQNLTLKQRLNRRLINPENSSILN